MQKVQVDSITLSGISTRTTNQNEMKPETAKISKLWRQFDSTVTVDYQNGERVYGVYYDYESDAMGAFSVLAGRKASSNDDASLEQVTIESGNYLRFDATATASDDNARIQAVIETWGKIWAYFSDNPDYDRTYKTDFEFYKDATHIEIYISIK